MRPRLTAVVPHWPLDEEVDDALRVCLASLPPDCEKIVVVNQGTGFAVNVNIGLRLGRAVAHYHGALGSGGARKATGGRPSFLHTRPGTF